MELIDITFNDILETSLGYIEKNDRIYNIIREKLTKKYFSSLNITDLNLILSCLVFLINFIYTKIYIQKDKNIFWEQLIQNNDSDLLAILYLLFPYLDTKSDTNKLLNLNDIYLLKGDDGNYVYSKVQYGRCVRHLDNNKIKEYDRPYLKEYLLQNLELLLMSIESCSNKLYVNWLNILPATMKNYQNSDLFLKTQNKLIGDATLEKDRSDVNVTLLNKYIDMSEGLPYQDVYNVIVNNLYYQIKTHKWLIYDIVRNGKLIPYYKYLQLYINFKYFIAEVKWSQLNKIDINNFKSSWLNLFNNNDENNKVILFNIYYFFSRYHVNREALKKANKLIVSNKNKDQEDAQKTSILDFEIAKNGLKNVPIEEIYLFFYNEIIAFKKTWYYYFLEIKNSVYISNNDNISITTKNLYNYAKSMSHHKYNKKFLPLPRFWNSLNPRLIKMILFRLLDVPNKKYNNWKINNWFNINKYILNFYPFVKKEQLYAMNFLISFNIRNQLTNIIFETMIYTGRLSVFTPNLQLTDNSNDEKLKRMLMKKIIFNDRKIYEDHAYYFVTNNSYGNLKPLCLEESNIKNQKYFDYLTESQDWTFTYALNWVSQINFYHKYINTRIMFVTGATGVGKSTQIPKLLMYSQIMLNYNANGKIICTEPRIDPTVKNSSIISTQLGVPILMYDRMYKKDMQTDNYYVQYSYSEGSHEFKTNAYLKFETDGKFFNELINYPFLTTVNRSITFTDSLGQKLDWMHTYEATNIYDTIIVDEAHEHNVNIDMILTLMHDVAYINNSIKLIIISATLENDEALYRRFYRDINDNRAYPLSSYIESNNLDRINVDRRIHISPPNLTTKYIIKDNYESIETSAQINSHNYLSYGIKKTISIANTTTSGDILLFVAGEADVKTAVEEINNKTASNIICLGFYGRMTNENRKLIIDIDKNIHFYTRYKQDVFNDTVSRFVNPGTYTRAIIVATNLAEASITLPNLSYIVDTGYSKINVYEPLSNLSEIITMPISESSSIQRRGRVGRTKAGEIFYLYDKAKIANNKSFYEIANANIKDIVNRLIKTYAIDLPIITDNNNVNNIDYLSIIKSKKTNIFQVFDNPLIYIDIIKHRYMYIPLPDDMSQFYYYYGKTDNTPFTTKNIVSYMLENHDDYDYQKTLSFTSRCHTGFNDSQLEDTSLSFYLVHPDENLFDRNLYTGKISKIKNSPLVKKTYYEYTCYNNEINVSEANLKDIINNMNHYIENHNIVFQKYKLAIDLCELELLTTRIFNNEIVSYNLKVNIENPDIINEKYYVDNYYNSIDKEYKGVSATITVKSIFNLDILEIKKIFSLSNEITDKNILWYIYGSAYGIQNEILGIINMLDQVDQIDLWLDKSKIELSLLINRNKNGDIFFLWKIWEELTKLTDDVSIDINALKTLFDNNKLLFEKRDFLPIEQYNIFKKLMMYNQLNSENEFYYYIVNLPNNIQNNNLKNSESIDIIARRYKINKEFLSKAFYSYQVNRFKIEKNKWIYQYKIDHYLHEDTNMNIIENVEKKIKFPLLFDPNKKWNTILETYIRTYAANLVVIDNNKYYNVIYGSEINKDYITAPIKNIYLENTLLNKKLHFLIYYENIINNDKSYITYLTPVNIDWVFKINPFFFLSFIENIHIPREMTNEFIMRSKLVSYIKSQLNGSYLLSLIEQLEIKNLSINYRLNK